MEDRRRAIISTCLDTFIENGLTQISMRDLGKAVNMEAAGLYWYFKDRDELVIACAEEASMRIENDFIHIAIENITDPMALAKKLNKAALEMRPLMNFFVSVCASAKYHDLMAPTLERLSGRYKRYTVDIAEKIGSTPERVAPYAHIAVDALLSYMVFGNSFFVSPQLKLVHTRLTEFLENKEQISETVQSAHD